MANFAGLTFAVVPVVTGAGALTAALTDGSTLIAGIVDPTSTQRIFNPQAEGNPVASGDTAATWLPVVEAISAASVNDQYWAPVFSGQSGATVTNPNTKVGQVKLQLQAAAKNTVEAASVMTFWLSPQALLITATGTF
jgi:hypothetical protein